ncbi:MAG: multidrug transporter permease [Paenibacillus sp.]|jgi:ABC-2 type transport system permease protein|nr:multidrug transporter permease [Paenibacillus sp.]
MRAWREIRTYVSVLKTTFAARMTYRGDFFISAFMIVIGDLIIPLVTFIIYKTGASFPGWSLYEALLIQATFMLAKGIAFPCFFGIVSNTLSRVRDGTFDILLLKPRSALYMTIVTSFQTENIGRLVGGLVLFTVACVQMDAADLQWMSFFWLFAMSLVVLFGFALFLSGIVFIWVGSSRVFEIFDAMTSFGMYPRSIFSKSFLNSVAFVIPVMMIGSMPAEALLGRTLDRAGLESVVCILFCAAGWLFWHRMLRTYTSAGG